MYLVHTIDLWHTTLLERSLIEGPDDVRPDLWRLGNIKRHIQYGTNPVLAEHFIHSICRKHAACQRRRGITRHRIMCYLVESKFTHLPNLVAEGHFGKQSLNLSLYLFIARDALRTNRQCNGSTQ